MQVDMPVYSVNTLSAGIPATQPTMKFIILNKLYFSRYLVDLSCNNNPVNDDIPESIQQIETDQLKLKSCLLLVEIPCNRISKLLRKVSGS